MPPLCAVPYCRSGSRYARSINQTCPMFKVPRNENLKRKWEEAIPGDVELKFGQVVCAKHFLIDQVLLKFELKDKFGNVTGRQDYKRPRLRENAVPSIFHIPFHLEESDGDSNSREHNYSINCSKSSNYLKDTEEQEDDCGELRDSSDTEMLQNNVFDRDLLKIISNNVPKESVNKKVQSIVYDHDLINVICKRKAKVLVEDVNTLVNASNTCDVSSSSNVNGNADCENDDDTREQNQKQNGSLQIKYKNTISINNEEVVIPKSWSLVHKNIDDYSTLIFLHSVSEMINESENKERIKKYVTYNCSNGRARYFAHGKEIVGIYEDHLLPRILSADLLVTTLLKFEKMRMCEGIKEDYMSHTIVGEYYMDKFNIWRTEQCTLLTRKFKCEYCKKLMKKLLERKNRWLHRVQAGTKLYSNALKLNTEYKREVDLKKISQRKSGISIIDEYVEEIDSLEFSNYQETIITKVRETNKAIKTKTFQRWD